MALATREASRGARVEVTRGQTPTPPTQDGGGQNPPAGGVERDKLARMDIATLGRRGGRRVCTLTPRAPWRATPI